MRARLCLLFLFCLLCFGVASASAGETIWTGLIYATYEKSPSEPPQQLKRMSCKLEKVFGYNQFQLLGEHRATIKSTGAQRWLLPGKPFSLSVETEPRSAEGQQLNLQLFQDKRLLVKSGATLRKGCPVLIKGPLSAKGQLIIALAVE